MISKMNLKPTASKTQPASSISPIAEAILQGLQALAQADQVIELRALGVRVWGRGFAVTASGYYSDLEKLAQDAAKPSYLGRGIAVDR